MRAKLNENILLWATSVLQPASARDVGNFISSIYPEILPLPKVHEIEAFLNGWYKEGYLVRVHGKSRLYSVTYKANIKLSVRLRRTRDKARLFLLKSIRHANYSLSGDRERDSVGVSPTIEGSSILQGTRPINPADVPRDPRTIVRFYWPRISKQLDYQVGPIFSSPDTSFKYYSFPSIKSIHKASHKPASGNDLSITDLSLAIGISPRLITSFIHAPKNHYRQYKIGKRGGGNRIIDSPRTFIKIVQYWILDYILYQLKNHSNCHSYQKGKSIVTNSLPHVKLKYVANIDIKEFFPSISQKMVISLLLKNNFGKQLSKAIARIVTLKNKLPQGAPTSPLISNALLYEFDEKISQYSQSMHLTYTRYADDITVSGNRKENILKVISLIRNSLISLGLSINDKKTRIATRGGQQRVTGVVVNEIAQPPRVLRKKIRAMFYNANREPEKYADKINNLKGYVSYLQSYPYLKDNKNILKYKNVCKKIALKIN